MSQSFDRRITQAAWIFDLEDRYVREQRRRSRFDHPRPFGAIKFWLDGTVVNGVPMPYARALEMVTVRNTSGYHLYFGRIKMPLNEDRQLGREQDSRRSLPLAPGMYSVRVACEFYQEQVRHDIQIPMPNPNQPGAGTPYFYDLVPGYAYPFPQTFAWRADPPVFGCPTPGSSEERRNSPTLLRGSLSTNDGQPVRGAQVRVDVGPRRYQYTTDGAGQWVLVFDNTHPSGPVTVQFSVPGRLNVNVDGVCVIRGRETVLHQTALRGWVQKEGVGVQGAAVSLSGQAQATATGADGSWFYYFEPTQLDTLVDVTATLPGGGLSQTQPGVFVRSRSTRVVETFRF